LTVDLSIVSSVDSKVSTSRPTSSASHDENLPNGHVVSSGPNGVTPDTHRSKDKATSYTTLTIHGYLPKPTSPPRSRGGHSKSNSAAQSQDKETVLLTLRPQSATLASEWLDGLLMLLNQQPITADTNKIVRLIGGYGLRIRLLNVRFEDMGLSGKTDGKENGESGATIANGGVEVKIPGREGVDDEYYYDIAGM
jgi:engulfment and cell motility protein 1